MVVRRLWYPFDAFEGTIVGDEFCRTARDRMAARRRNSSVKGEGVSEKLLDSSFSECWRASSAAWSKAGGPVLQRGQKLETLE